VTPGASVSRTALTAIRAASAIGQPYTPAEMAGKAIEVAPSSLARSSELT